MSPVEIWGWLVGLSLADLQWVGKELLDNLVQLLAAGGYAAARATGITVETGHHGLKFSFGRVSKVVGPGFHLLVPGLQTIREVPTRAHTIDLEAQRVVTLDGLVYDVDTNATWRIDDVAVALVQVDDLGRAMSDALAITVHDVVRHADSEALAEPGRLDRNLVDALTARVKGWGLTVEAAGFSTLTPTPETLRITQLAGVVAARRQALRALVDAGTTTRRALGLLGSPGVFRTRGGRLRRLEADHRWRSAVIASLNEAGAPPEHIEGWERQWRARPT